MLTQDIAPNTRITLRKVPTDATMTEVLLERNNDARDGTWAKTQFFLTNDEMLHLEDTIAMYNQTFVDPQIQLQMNDVIGGDIIDV